MDRMELISPFRRSMLMFLLGAALAIPAAAVSLVSSESFRYPKMLTGECMVFLAALYWLWAGRREQKGEDLGVLLAWAGLLSAAGSFLWSRPHVLAGGAEISRLAALWMLFWLMRRVDRPWRFTTLVMAAALLNSAFAFMQAAGWRPVWWKAWEGRHAVYGTFGNPNFFAEYLAPLAIVALGRAFTAPEAGRRWGSIALWAAFLSLLFITASRSAWLGLTPSSSAFPRASSAAGDSPRSAWTTAAP